MAFTIYVSVLVTIKSLMADDWAVNIPHYRKHNENDICYQVISEPYYSKASVIGKPWQAYYAWNMQYTEMCLKTIFKVPHNMRKIVMFLKSKHYALYDEPNWSKPELVMYRGECKEMVLFRDKNGVPGQYDGVPYFKRDAFPGEPLLTQTYKMTIKVLQRGKYLLFSDCTTGVTLLLAHPENRPKRVEIEDYASKFDFGQPFQACINEPDPVIKNETIEVSTTTESPSTKKKVSKYDW